MKPNRKPKPIALTIVDGDYTDRARQIDHAAKEERKAMLVELIGKFSDAAQARKDATITGAKMAWLIGDSIMGITGHEKLNEVEFGNIMNGDTGNALAELPKSRGFAFAKECLSFRRANPEGAPTEYAPAAGVMDRVFLQLEILPHEGHGEQTLRPHEPFREFVTEVNRVGVAAMKMKYAIENKQVSKSEIEVYKRMFFSQLTPILELKKVLEAL